MNAFHNEMLITVLLMTAFHNMDHVSDPTE